MASNFLDAFADAARHNPRGAAHLRALLAANRTSPLDSDPPDCVEWTQPAEPQTQDAADAP